MKFVTFAGTDGNRAGLVLDGGAVLDLAAAATAAGIAADLGSVLAIIAGGDTALAAVKKLAAEPPASAVHPAGSVKLLAPIPRPLKNVFCVGRNYLDHVKEGHNASGTEVKVPVVPQFFSKPPTAVTGPDSDVRLDPKVTSKMDYEVELGVVIGTTGRDIKAEDAYAHIFGYTIINDVTARDLQRRHEQWHKGKSLDTSCPMGPWIVHKSAISDPTKLELSLTVNGEQRQHATTAQMIFDIPTIIASLSAGLTLEAGDIIATGTPSGVGYAMDPPHFLKGGDEMVLTIAEIGTLRNRIVEV
jgi:2-keto-4-pentenoate hydratase/2-oxohepta-3-ene-1,7-dioic acid hydratase in catechol pathway